MSEQKMNAECPVPVEKYFHESQPQQDGPIESFMDGRMSAWLKSSWPKTASEIGYYDLLEGAFFHGYSLGHQRAEAALTQAREALTELRKIAQESLDYTDCEGNCVSDTCPHNKLRAALAATQPKATA